MHVKRKRSDFTNQRKKTGLALSDRHIAICDACRERFKLGSRNDFVEQAIEHYQNYLTSGDLIADLNDTVSETIERRLSAITRNIADSHERIDAKLDEVLLLLSRRR